MISWLRVSVDGSGLPKGSCPSSQAREYVGLLGRRCIVFKSLVFFFQLT